MLTEEEKIALQYFFECYFRNETLSENFVLPKTRFSRAASFGRAQFKRRTARFFFGSSSPVKNSLAEVLDFFADLTFLFVAVCLLFFRQLGKNITALR